MSRFCVTTAAIVTAIVLSDAAPAEGRARFGFGHIGALKFGMTRLFAPGLFHRSRAHHRGSLDRQIRRAPAQSQSVHSAINKPTGENASDVGRLFTDPTVRGQKTAIAALAFRQASGDPANGWWSHGHGGYGWVGPLFWPFAYDDIYAYTIFGDHIGFWDYGSPDIYAGIFGPYRKDELTKYGEPGASDRKEQKFPGLVGLCGEHAHEIASLAIGHIQQRVQPNEGQQAAFDHLADASKSAALIIQASCPTKIVSTAPARLELMQQRVEAMLGAVVSLEAPLDDLYGLLDDQQKARLNALAAERRRTADENDAAHAAVQECKILQPAALRWPATEIENALHPNDVQRRTLEPLQQASTRAAAILNYECEPEDLLIPPARLAAIDRRLDAMREAINQVGVGLENFYATLSDEQKSNFEAIGPKRTP